MKKTIVLVFSATFFLCSNAQDFEKNGNYISAGYGLGTFNPFVNLFVNNTSSTTIGPGMIVYERGVTDVLGIGRIGVGASFNTTFYGRSGTSSLFGTITRYNDRRTRIGLIARCAYHFDFDVKNLDFYSGVGFGFYYNLDEFEQITTTINNNTSKVILPPQSFVFPGFSIFSGARYYLNDTFGLYSELGFSTTSFFQLGVVFRL